MFVAVAAAIFGEAEREVTVAAGFGGEDAVVVGTVHGLEEVALAEAVLFEADFEGFLFECFELVIIGAEPFGFEAEDGIDDFEFSGGEGFVAFALVFFEEDHGGEHGFGVIGEVAGCFVHAFPGEVGGAHAVVAGVKLGFLGELFEFFNEDRAFGEPEGHAGADVVGVDGEEAHFGADFSVVASFSFLEHIEVGLELGFIFERGAVDTLELGVIFVSFVVGAGDGHQLIGADVTGSHDVWAGAEVDEVPVLEVADGFAFGDGFEEVEFIFAGGIPF
ncbi:MAG: hypothetical protein RI897_3938 [Verrucomicrobiota bacterium]